MEVIQFVITEGKGDVSLALSLLLYKRGNLEDESFDIDYFDNLVDLFLKYGAKWRYDMKPDGCDSLTYINGSKERCTTLLHGLKGLLPKDLVSQIVTEIYDNRMKKE